MYPSPNKLCDSVDDRPCTMVCGHENQYLIGGLMSDTPCSEKPLQFALQPWRHIMTEMNGKEEQSVDNRFMMEKDNEEKAVEDVTEKMQQLGMMKKV